MSVANAYAKALHQAATESKSGDLSKACDQIQHQLNEFIQLIDSNKEAAIALTGPITTSREKANLVSQITQKMGFSPLVSNFLNLLAMKGRLNLIHEVTDDFSAERLQAEGGVPGRLIAAETMTEADIAGLAAAFSKKLGKKVVFQVSTDPSLLAGVKVVVNGVTYDGTLKVQLDRLRDQFAVGMSS